MKLSFRRGDQHVHRLYGGKKKKEKKRKIPARLIMRAFCVDIHIYFFASYLSACRERNIVRAIPRVMQRGTLHSAASADFTWRMGGRFIDTHRRASDAPHLTPARNLQRRRVGITRAPVLRGPRYRVYVRLRGELKRNRWEFILQTYEFVILSQLYALADFLSSVYFRLSILIRDRGNSK